MRLRGLVAPRPELADRLEELVRWRVGRGGGGWGAGGSPGGRRGRCVLLPAEGLPIAGTRGGARVIEAPDASEDCRQASWSIYAHVESSVERCGARGVRVGVGIDMGIGMGICVGVSVAEPFSYLSAAWSTPRPQQLPPRRWREARPVGGAR